MLQSTFTALNQSLLKNNLWPLYKLLSFFFLLFTQLWLLIWTLCTKISFWPFLVTQLLQNISLQMANGLQTPMVFSILMTESTYHLLAISTCMFSSIIIITFLLNILIRTKHWNQFTTDIPSLASILMYNNSASSMSLVCNLSHNITSLMDFSNNSLSLNDYRILFLQTSLRNSHYSLSLILF